MNVISEQNQTLSATVSLQEIEGIFGLVMESYSGKKGTPQERNLDYIVALDTILKRLRNTGVERIKVYLVSKVGMTLWKSMDERALEIEGATEIIIQNRELVVLRKLIGNAQKEKKKDPSSKGGNSTKRILIDADISVDIWETIVTGNAPSNLIWEGGIIAGLDGFDPNNVKESKDRIYRAIAVRRGQQKFRESLLKAYNQKCAITNTNAVPVLEAAHIIPYKGIKTNHITNGILLRADMHLLFDCGLVGIDQEYKVMIASSLSNTEYRQYQEQAIQLPTKINERPNRNALALRPLRNS